MKFRNSRILITAASALLLAPASFAESGTWIDASGGSWSDEANWAGGPPGIIAEGSGFTADFSTLNITADATVNLDGARTIGNLIFGDTDTSSIASWFVSNGTGGPLTLAGGSPTITVNPLGTGNNRNATITATLEGSNGFTKNGTGVLVLNNNTNTISGPVVVSAGNLNIQSKPLTNATSVALNGGVLIIASITGNAIGSSNDMKITFAGGTLQYNVDTPATDYSARFSTEPVQQYRVFMNSPRVVTFSNSLSSEGGILVKTGTGTLILNAENTFTGATTSFAGNLQLDNALALQNSAIDTNASSLGTASLGIVLGSGVTSPTFGGLTGNKALASLFDTDTGNYNLVTNVTLKPVTGADYTYTGAIADGRPALDGGMTLTKSGPGRQVLNAVNTYTGGTIMNAGTLNYSNASALSSGPITFTGGAILQAGVATTLANPISVTGVITGTVGTAGFATTLSGAITGTGTLAKGGAGVLTLTGGLANTIAGGFRVASGRLNVTDGLSLTNTGPVTVLSGGSLNYSKNFASGNDLTNALTLSGPGDGTFGALNLWGNATATGAITLDVDATISHDFNNATISGSITGTDRNLTLRTITASQPGIVVSGDISLGTGGITAQGVANSGLFSIKLSGTNSYTGETRVVSGTLLLSDSARINDNASVRIDSGAVLHLDFEGTDTVGALYLGGDLDPQPEGTYGAVDSGAEFESAFFAGSGILEVGTPTNDFASWAASQTPPVTGGANGDDNNNGVPNLVEYALADGEERGVLSGTTITFTKRGAPYGGDLTYVIETSETLTDPWTPVVTQGPSELGSPLSYDLAPAPGTPKKFARMKVQQQP
jgi:autotransporter-associated beta strand protein